MCQLRAVPQTDSTQGDGEGAPRASKTSQLQDQKSVERWATAYRLSTQSPASRPSTLRRLSIKSGGIFQHEPLSHVRPSVRLIYLLPDLSPEGLVRCVIFHSWIESPYACLSYEWTRALHLRGDRQSGFDERLILVNERPFLVRENLYDFLCTARHNATRGWHLNTIDLSTPLWIDAICIDQSNQLERNHQVKLMGIIYSQARRVHAWLGIAVPPAEGTGIFGSQQPSANEYTQQLETEMKQWVTETKSFSDLADSNHNLDRHVSSYITQNTYWKRAWVVQEICLAQELTIWVHTVPINSDIAETLQTSSFWRTGELDHFDRYRYARFKKLARTSLLTTLDQFKDKECADPRDRVYSLLSLCSTGASAIPVDYNIEIDQLAYHVLRSHPGPVCLCSALAVARQLHLLPAYQKIGKRADIRDRHTPWIEVNFSSKKVELSHLHQVVIDLSATCTSLHWKAHAVSEGYLASLWRDGEAGYHHPNDDGRTYTMRIALYVLGGLADNLSSMGLCQSVLSEVTVGTEAVRIGMGHDDVGLSPLEVLT